MSSEPAVTKTALGGEAAGTQTHEWTDPLFALFSESLYLRALELAQKSATGKSSFLNIPSLKVFHCFSAKAF